MCEINDIRHQMPLSVSDKLVGFENGDMKCATELCIKPGYPAALRCPQGISFSKGSPICVGELERIIFTLCGYSSMRVQEALKQGYLTIKGGHRVGICCSAIGELRSKISAISIRVARQRLGCAEKLHTETVGQSVLFCGPPMSGKTTILRDYARLLSEKYRTAIVDERSEIAGMYESRPSFSLGFGAFILDGYNRAEGIENSVRCLSPDYIVCDELYRREDFEVSKRAVNSGVKLIASLHTQTNENFWLTHEYSLIKESGLFEFVVLMGQDYETELRRI